MKTLVTNEQGFKIYFEALEEDRTIKELLPEETDEQITEIQKNNVVFCAKVSAEKEGIELSCVYLGGCILEHEEDFYKKYKNDYFEDMKAEAIQEAKENLKDLIEKLQE